MSNKPISFNYDDYRLLLAENTAMKKNEADFIKQINTLERQLQCCRDELCLRCGRYTNAHGGACDGCRWK